MDQTGSGMNLASGGCQVDGTDAPSSRSNGPRRGVRIIMRAIYSVKYQ